MIELLNLYSDISNQDSKLFESLVDTFLISKGDYLLFDGEIQDKLFLIKSGVTATYLDNDAKQKYIDFSYQNRFAVDIRSFIKQSQSEFCIRCLDDSEVQSISFNNLQTIFDKSPKIERAFRILTENLLIASIEKSIIMETKNINDRFKWVMNKKPELFKLLPNKLIASYINIDITNFSKLYKQYCLKENLIYR